jgi:subtilase family serine protease
MPGSVSPLARQSTDLGPAPASETHRIVVALALRERGALEAFLRDVHDPTSPNHRRFLTLEEFNARHAPTPEDEEALVSYLEQNGLRVSDHFPNRLLVGASGSVQAIERAFGIRLHRVRLGGRDHFAALEEPRFPVHLANAIVGIIGLDDLSEMHPRARSAGPVAAPRASIGGHCCSLSPNDLAIFYDRNTSSDGAGQTIVIAGAYAWKDSDNIAFNAHWGLAQLPTGSGQVCTGSGNPQGCRFNQQQSIEIALDVEYAHGAAPGAVILNYMSASTSFADFAVAYNRIVTDNPGHVVTTSWGACEAGVASSTQAANDQIFASGNAIGQSWFAASGDAGSRDCNNLLGVDHPANSPHMIGVGGTSPTCSGGMTPGSPACAGYGSESGWSGSGGGASNLFSRPSWQTGCGVPAGGERLVPDVALEADPSPGNYVLKGGFWYVVSGTSGAAPQWAGTFALVNQAVGGSGLGDPGALLYDLCGTNAYHDITTGSNGDYSTGAGYDLVTGLGTIETANFVAAVTLPEPGMPVGLVASLAMLTLLRRRKRSLRALIQSFREPRASWCGRTGETSSSTGWSPGRKVGAAPSRSRSGSTRSGRSSPIASARTSRRARRRSGARGRHPDRSRPPLSGQESR